MKKEDIKAIYRIYIKWLSIPKDERRPPTLDDFCSQYDIEPSTILHFQDNKSFSDDLNKETMKWAKKKTPEMIHTLYQKYKDSRSPQDLRIWQDAIKYEDEHKKATTLEDLISEFKTTPEQLLQIAERIIKKYDKA